MINHFDKTIAFFWSRSLKCHAYPSVKYVITKRREGPSRNIGRELYINKEWKKKRKEKGA